MKTYQSLITKFGFSALALAIAVGFIVVASVALAVPTKCWCCQKDKRVSFMYKADCQKSGGHCYGTAAEANKACGIRGGPNRDQKE